MQTLFRRPDKVSSPLYIVTVVFNAARWRTRWKLYQDFAKRVAESHAILYTVEVAFGERAFVVTEPDNPHHVQLRTSSELWLKENALNIGISRLPYDWRYVAWIDADVNFVRDDWADETLHALQHYDVVQVFSEAADLDSNYEIIARYRSFGWAHIKGIPWQTGNPDYRGVTPPTVPKGPYQYLHHPGFGWAYTRAAYDRLGGLFDVSIIGEADFIMARSYSGDGLTAVRKGCSPGYIRTVTDWQQRATKYIAGNIGYVPGCLLHYWHGAKTKRRYWDRTQLLVDTQYDPALDLKRDSQMLYQLTDRSPALRTGLRAYFAQRDEDAPTPTESH